MAHYESWAWRTGPERRMITPPESDWVWHTRSHFVDFFGENFGEVEWQQALSREPSTMLQYAKTTDRRVVSTYNSDDCGYTAQQFLDFFGPGLAEHFWARARSSRSNLQPNHESQKSSIHDVWSPPRASPRHQLRSLRLLILLALQRMGVHAALVPRIMEMSGHIACNF